MTRASVKLAAAALSLGVAALLGEGLARAVGGYRLLGSRLERPAPSGTGSGDALLRSIDDVVAPLAQRLCADRKDLDPGWLRTSPPPVPAPPPLDLPLLPQRDWLLHYYVLNDVLLHAMWVKGQGLPMLPGLQLPERFTTFAPPSGGPQPRYRYPASRTLPTGLRTNAFGFRGRELNRAKPERTIRIGFVGASTTVEAHGIPFSAPELIEHWLSLWAAQQGLKVQFETLNAAREAVQSSDLAAIVQDELLPLDVDYVVYYEGANQLQPSAMVPHVQIDQPYTLAQPPAGLVGDFDDAGGTTEASWFDLVCRHSAVAERLRTALRRTPPQVEPNKPEQRIQLPSGFADAEFPLDRCGEVLQCGAIRQDLETIRQTLAAQQAKLVLCTFAWLCEDGMTTDPVLGRNIFIHLNRAYWPFRYATVRALADLQNRFFRAFAQQHGMPLIDVAGLLPMDQRLYIDAIHHNELGVRLKAFVMFAQLTNLFARDLDAGRVPAAPRPPKPTAAPTLRTLTPADLDAGR